MTKTNKKTKQVLGRGLGNLLPVEPIQEQVNSDQAIIEIDISHIRKNPENPRKKFDQTSIQELSLTIKQHGLLQPILVMKQDEKDYMVISGERRLRAYKKLNKKKIPCIVKEYSNSEKLEISLIENIQREQLDAIEEAMVYKNLLENFNLTQNDLSSRVGKNRATISNRVRLLQLPLKLQTAIADRRLTEGQVRPVLGIKDEITRQRITEQILSNDLSARKIELMARRYKQRGIPFTSVKQSPDQRDPHLMHIKNSMEERLVTRVKILNHPKKNQGKIIIEYFNLDDFDRIQKLILNKPS